jgi:hypothetical protein
MSPRARTTVSGWLLAAGLMAGLPASAQSAPVAMKFHSETFRPAAVHFGNDPDHSSGDILLTPRFGYQRHVNFQRGPMVVDGRGHLVWFHPLPKGELANNLEVQHYMGQPVLTWWQGTDAGARAEDVIMNRNYRTVAIVRASGGYQADTHEFQISHQNTALISAVGAVKADLSRFGGPRNGRVDDCVIQNIDIKTGKVLWTWHSLAHIPLRASYTRPIGSTPWDYLHLNSIQQLSNGNLVVSARNTWAVYEIDHRRGGIVWTLGGKRSRFKVGPLAKFEWQHDARLYGDSLSVFDDASDGPEQQESQSSAKVLTLNFRTMTAVLAHRYVHSPSVVSVSQGNAQRLGNRNVFVGWGSAPEFSEYTVNGRQIFNGTFALGVESYRAYRFPWTGQPTTRPAMANAPGPSGTVNVYASWNGATKVAAWRVLGGPSSHSLVVLDPRTPKHGFETEIKLHSEPQYFEVQALDNHGHVLGTSDPHRDRAHVAIFSPAAFVSSPGGQSGVPVGCWTGRDCTVSVTVTSGGSTLAHTSGTHISSNTGALVGLRLSAAGEREVQRASGHRLPVQVSARDSSGASASTHMFLIPYTVSGSSPQRSLSQSPTIHVISPNAFVSSSSGQGAVLAGCYGGAPCHPQATLSVNGTPIASTQTEHLGTDELGNIYFQLNDTGKLLLSQAPGNQLGAQLKLTSGGDTATGHIDVISYSQ